MKTIKKLLAVALTLAMVLSVAPTIATNVRAGDGTDIKNITKGTNADGSVYLTKPMTIKMSDITSGYGLADGFKSRVEQGKAHLQIEVYTTKLDYNSLVRRENMTYNKDDGVFTFYPNQIDKGKYYLIYVDDDEGTNLNDSNWWLVKGCTYTITSGPTLNGHDYHGSSLVKKDIYILASDDIATYTIEDEYNVNVYRTNCYVRLYKDGKVVSTTKLSGSQAVFKNVDVDFARTNSYRAQLIIRIPGINDIVIEEKYSFALNGAYILYINVKSTMICKK